MTSAVDVSVRSDVGVVRSVNEDSMLAVDPVFVVADGMGGHARGDAASQAAVATLARVLPAGARPTPDEVIAAIDEANTAVRALSGAEESGIAVAGTTLTGVVRVRVPDNGEQWMVVNVGDSRVYRWNGRELDQLTVDHSAVQELVDAGLITVAQAAVHPERNVITRALGAEDLVDTDVLLVEPRGRQTFLICSDGLTKELDDTEIARILADTRGAYAADALVEAAIEAGGRDNVTVVVVESVTGEADSAAEDTRDRVEETGSIEDTRPRG
ncbi:PP2C family protein-serine/threonine phosphatase [Leifsonia poae]|uniref:PP2C family protein-serine/threonine phosphatase n=1 Tax=Leifsonia poae TaxID=110933 RepID=UPI001CBF3F0A|nr:protein phosphatase 2C domain-containing protein [Leifsonia poae]